MLRTINIVLVGLMVAGATITYQIKHHAEEKLGEVRGLQAAIQTERDTIDLLEADWSLLNQPGRIQALIDGFSEDMQLQTIQPTQIASPQELPAKVLRVEDLLMGDPIDPAEGIAMSTMGVAN